jgi:preprotein translocase subunit YajC
MEALVYAAEAAPAGGTPQNMFNMLIPFILIFGVMYMLLIRPQKKKQDKLQQMLKSLKKGDKVITSSGLYGIVVKVSEKDVILEVADKVNLRFSLGAIGTVRDREEKKEAD